MNRFSEVVRTFWLCCCVACCLAAVAATLWDSPKDAAIFAASGIVFFLMSSFSHADLDQ